MALSGALSDFAVDEVLRFVGETGKSGTLTVEDGSRRGQLWLEDGAVVGAGFADVTAAAEVAFELLRLPSGRFTFDQAVRATEPQAALSVGAVLADARAMLAEWQEIEKVVPSLATLVVLSPESPNGEVHIPREEWATVCAIGAGGPVSQVAERLALREFAACKAVKALVDAGLAAVAPAVEGVGRPRLSAA